MSAKVPLAVRQRLNRLRRVYDRVPGMKCQGHCGPSFCGPVPFLPAEQIHLQVIGHPIPRFNALTLQCDAYDSTEQRCTVYGQRPVVCRLWGVVSDLRCPWGCEPEAILTRQQAYHLVAEVERL